VPPATSFTTCTLYPLSLSQVTSRDVASMIYLTLASGLASFVELLNSRSPKKAAAYGNSKAGAYTRSLQSST